MSFRLILIILFTLFFQSIYTQKIVTDTVHINFSIDSIFPANYFWQSVTDKRGVNPKLVSYSQTKKYVLLPIDQELCVQDEIAHIISSNKNTSFSSDTLLLELDYFIIEKYKGRFFNPYILYADMPVKQVKNGIVKDIGVISYNFEYKPFKNKTPYSQACEEVLTNWHRQFKIDMISVVNYMHTNTEKPEILLTENINKPYFFNFTVGGAAGLNFWQVEGDIHFTRPETSINRWFTGSFIRYQNTPEFEMIGFGKKQEHFTKRISDKTLLDISTNTLLGLNKWKNTKDIKLWQIMQISFSSAQSINFEPKNKSGILFKVGLFENLYYIVQKNLGFQIGPYLSIGYKF
jgi:hypothetical protein